jgi:hemerythrin-like domain-containing protein
MSNAIAAWHAEHVRFARMLDLFEVEVARFHDEDSPDYDTMLDIVSYLHDYADRFHHPREDLAFSCLLRHDAGLKPQINRLLQEHRVIARAGEVLRGLLNEVVNDAFVSRESLESAAATYLAYYRNHLDTEERDILPLASKLLDDSDWAKVTVAMPSAADPLFDAQIQERYRSLRARL